MSPLSPRHTNRTPRNSEADAAADRLVEACGGRDEESAARVCVLVQGHAAIEALIATRHEGSDGPPVPRSSDDDSAVRVEFGLARSL
jgi:hypothetical protein